MTSVHAVASYLPPRSMHIGSYLSQLDEGENADLYERFYGFAKVRRDADGTIADQMCAAAGKLVELRGREQDVRYVVHTPTIQLTAPYPRNPLGVVCRSLGLDRAFPFSVTQHACASALLAIEVCGKLLAADGDPDGLALVLAGEKTFTRVAQLIPNSAVMGEGMAAVLISGDGDQNRMLAYATRTLGQFYRAPYLAPDVEATFQGAYTATLVEVVLAALTRANLTTDDVHLLMPHNVNRMSWLRVLRLLRMSKEQLFLDNQVELGHCFGADSFINYQTAFERGRLRTGDIFVMTAAGLGATLAAMVFRH